MGADIHTVVEVKRRNDTWEAIPDLKFYDGNRCYAVFAFLAGVRNYSAIEPISALRKFPKDISDFAREYFLED